MDLRVSEIFYSIQGEGPTIGYPAMFLRLFGCNLKCSWCDSKYAWQNREYRDLAVSEVAEAMTARRIVVTGGEPLLQSDALSELARMLIGRDCELETNGTILAPPTLVDLGWRFNVSPKLASSGNALAQRHRPEVLRHFSHLPHTWFKFTVATQEDLDEVMTLTYMGERVILMPEGTDTDTLLERGVWLAEICKSCGWRFSPRLQIELYGNRRGV